MAHHYVMNASVKRLKWSYSHTLVITQIAKEIHSIIALVISGEKIAFF